MNDNNGDNTSGDKDSDSNSTSDTSTSTAEVEFTFDDKYSTTEDPGTVFEEMQRNDDESHNEAIYNNED
eukprot:8401155-Ditylum_brightwellii.AAC.1